jgi:uncharacterized protein
MNTFFAPSHAPSRLSPDAVSQAAKAAMARIPPLWPLRHFVAVNPFQGLVDRPFSEACSLLQQVTGAAPLQPAKEYRRLYDQGAIRDEDLAAVGGVLWSPAALLAALDAEIHAEPKASLATVADLLDQREPKARWADFVTREVSKWCAVIFDDNQTTWACPWRDAGLYAGWRDASEHDLNPEAFGLVGFRAFVSRLDRDPLQAIRQCLEYLDPQSVPLEDFLHRQLASIPGWAGHVQYRVREDAMRGKENTLLADLLAIRLAYDAALYAAFARDGVFRSDWRHQEAGVIGASSFPVLAIWQRAYEVGYCRQLARELASRPAAARARRPDAQAIFCIDVRSEILRRHLEAAQPGIQTIGFAGFFGFLVAHAPAGSSSETSRCPVLLVPPVSSCEPLPAAEAARAVEARSDAGAWKAFQNSAASCFTFVETAGLAFGAALGRAGKARSCSRVTPSLGAVGTEARAAMAAGALRNMSLTSGFGRVVLVCGHGSQSANNPYASSLDCGACGGHAGDVNARLAAATFNDPAVRTALAQEGITIPADTVFVAGLHNTSTDDVVLFDLDQIPASHQPDIASLREALGRAGAATRRERAPRLGIATGEGRALDQAVRARAADVAQVRPEWGLANNAAFVAAPRARTAGLRLDGRVFLHDYDAAADKDSSVLTLILCAPVVVASWINLQYYASRVDPVRYGAGNKVLHNVMGGVGAVEGNAGDIKVGLPLQSIHDGSAFTHEPRRLAVYVDAPRERIGAVLAAAPQVGQLFDNGWIHLYALEGDRCWERADGAWRPA